MAPPDCQLCEDTAATLYCKQCQENFCQEVRVLSRALAFLSSLKSAVCPCVILPNLNAPSQCFEALHYSGKRQGHEVTPVQQSVQNSPVKPQPPASAPIGIACMRATMSVDTHFEHLLEIFRFCACKL